MDQAVLHAAKQQDKGQGAETDAQKFHLNMGEEFFSVQVSKCWNRWPIGVEECLSAEIFSSYSCYHKSIALKILGFFSWHFKRTKSCCSQFVLLSCCDISPKTFEKFRYLQANLKDVKKYHRHPSLKKIQTVQGTKRWPTMKLRMR